MKKILKWFLPKPETFAKIAAESISKNINQSETMQKLSEYGEYAETVTDIQKQLVEMLKDGKINTTEEEKIAEMLTPIFDKLIKMI